MVAKSANGHAAAVNRLAPETLARIFTIALTSEVISDPDASRWSYGFGKSPTIPLAVSSVCQKWRQVAVETNSLWSVIYYGYNTTTKRWESVSRVRLWLLRSKGANLDIRLTCGRLDVKQVFGFKTTVTIPYTVSEGEAIDFVDGILQSHLQRCERLRLLVPDANLVPHILSTLKSNPSSTILCVDLASSRSKSQSYPSDTFDGLWPSLREFSLRYFDMAPPGAMLRSLTRLHFEDMKAARICTEDFLVLLQSCPGLIELQIRDMEPVESYGDEEDEGRNEDDEDGQDEGGDGSPGQPIHLPKLTTLGLRMLPAEWVTKLTSRLVVPALRHLTTAQFYQNNPSEMDDGMPSLISSLTKLDMSHVESFKWDTEEEADRTCEEDVAWLLCHLPELRTLDIGGCSECSNDFINILFQDVELPGRPHRLCPKLEDIKGVSASPSVVKLLKARRSSGRVSPIRRFHASAKEVALVKDLVEEVVLD